MSGRGERVGVNEALFREVNERIDQLHDDLGGASAFEIVCECGDASCIQRFTIENGAYQALRRHSRRFAVVPGHEQPDVERTVEERGTYLVVEKTDPGAIRAADATA